MQTYTFGIYSLKEIKYLDISTDVEGLDMNQLAIVSDLKLVLTGNSLTPDGTIMIAQVEDTHECNFTNLLEVYKNAGIPQLKALPSLFLKKIGKGNYYAVSLNRPLSIAEMLAVCNKIDVIQNGGSFEEKMNEYGSLFNELLLNYEIHAADGTKRFDIGLKERENRECRYCHKNNTDTTFKKVAHTISEGLGNKMIVTNDECDKCNEYFGKDVEPAIMEYLDFFRTWFGVHGKKGVIHHKYGGNYVLKKEADKTVNLGVTLTDEEIESLSKEVDKNLDIIKLQSQQEVELQSIYRSLVKYALGILPTDKMVVFDKTAEWLLGKRTVDELPLVRIEISTNYEEHPKVVVMLRKNKDETLPYAVSEICIMNIRFLFIIPLCNDRDKDFLGNDYWERFIGVFKMYKITHWQIQNFSKKEKKRLVMNVKFV